MAFDTLPDHAQGFGDWSWDQIAPYYQDLFDRPLTADTLPEWLKDWSRLDRLGDQTEALLIIATTTNTADIDAERRHRAFSERLSPALKAANQRIREKLLASGLEPPELEHQVKRLRTAVSLFRAMNLPLQAEVEKLIIDYQKLTGAWATDWEGQHVTLVQLAAKLKDPDRNVRERAWRKIAERHAVDEAALGTLWQKLLELRRKIAENSGLTNYREYAWQSNYRFDYTPDDCKTFAEAVETVIVPLVAKLRAKRAQNLGLETFRPWDLAVDSFGRPPLRPFGTIDELERKTETIFKRLDPALGDYFATLRRENRLDLADRPNKAPGGYCMWSEIHLPFIFMHAANNSRDILTLVHESGHAFHHFETRNLPYYVQLRPGREFTEVASTAMELLTSPFWAGVDGFYSEADADRALREYLGTALSAFPYYVQVDLFQHWVYEHEDSASDPAACDAQWAVLSERFDTGVDWQGLAHIRATGWRYAPRHIFRSPFYYIEYALSHLGTFQIWRNAQRDRASAVAAYRQALSYGGTRSLRELYEVAGAKLAFDAETVRAAIAPVWSLLESDAD